MYTDFEFAGKRLSDFGYIVCKFNSSSDATDVEIGCDITFNSVKNNHSSIRYKTSTSYENVYTTYIEIMKNPCRKNQDELYHQNEEISVLTTWLNRRGYHKFKPLSSTDDFSSVHYYGSFNVKEKVINDRVVGLCLSFEGNAPYGFGNSIKNEFDENETFFIHGEGDEYTLIYPVVTVSPKIDCVDIPIEIENRTTGTKVILENLKANETIRLHGEHKIIVSDNEEHSSSSTFYDDFNYEWLDIKIEDGFYENEYYVNVPCYISIEYEPIRKVGVC